MSDVYTDLGNLWNDDFTDPKATPPLVVTAPKMKFSPGHFQSSPRACYCCGRGTESAYCTPKAFIPVCTGCYIDHVLPFKDA